MQGPGLINMREQTPKSTLAVLVAYCSVLMGNRSKHGKVAVMQLGQGRNSGMELSMDMLGYLEQIILNCDGVGKDRRVKALKDIFPSGLESEAPSVVDNPPAQRLQARNFFVGEKKGDRLSACCGQGFCSVCSV